MGNSHIHSPILRQICRCPEHRRRLERAVAEECEKHEPDPANPEGLLHRNRTNLRTRGIPGLSRLPGRTGRVRRPGPWTWRVGPLSQRNSGDQDRRHGHLDQPDDEIARGSAEVVRECEAHDERTDRGSDSPAPMQPAQMSGGLEMIVPAAMTIVTRPAYEVGTPRSWCMAGQPAPTRESGRPRLTNAR